MEDTKSRFDFVRGSDIHLRYKKLLGTGGSGSVHELYNVVSQRVRLLLEVWIELRLGHG